MKNLNVLIYAVLVLAVTFIIIYFLLSRETDSFSDDQDLNGKSDSIEAVDHKGDRDWKRVNWKEYELKSEIQDSVFTPIFITQHNGNIFITDHDLPGIVQFDYSGKFKKNFGQGRGEGPAQFLSPTVITFEDNRAIVSDTYKMDIQEFSIDTGELVNQIPVEHQKTYLSKVDSKYYTTPATEENVISIINKEGSREKSFGSLVENAHEFLMSLGGALEYSKSLNELVYVTNFASFIFYFDPCGEKTRIVRTLDGIPFQKTHSEDSPDQTTMYAPNPEFRQSNKKIIGDKLYINSVKGRGDPDVELQSFMDVYSVCGKEYHYSLKLPFGASDFTYLSQSESNGIWYFIDETADEIDGVIRALVKE